MEARGVPVVASLELQPISVQVDIFRHVLAPIEISIHSGHQKHYELLRLLLLHEKREAIHSLPVMLPTR